MLTPENRLRPKDEEVVAKVMDGEAVIINLANGMYYSLDNVGALVWTLVLDGCRMDEIAAVIASRYEVAPARAREDVLELAAHLLREDLVAIDAANERPPGAPPASAAQKSPYESPSSMPTATWKISWRSIPPTPGLADIPWKQ